MEKYKIGIGLTSHNRPEVFKETLKKIKQFKPKGAKIVVVDDGSTVKIKNADFRFNQAQGIAIAKNKCLELLDGCDYVFLFDDDIFPKVKDWHLPYIESGLNHMQYTFGNFSNGRKNGRLLVRKDHKFSYWAEPCGCMNFYTREAIEKVGGMDPDYGIWGYEHVGHSMRIHHAGLTPQPFIDVVNSNDLFYSYDFDQTTKRSVDPSIRSAHIQGNKAKYERERNAKSSHFIPYKPLNSIVLTSYLTAAKDPQRNENFTVDVSSVVPLFVSCAENKAKVAMISDCFEQANDGHLDSVRVEPDYKTNPYFRRWQLYYDYLVAHPEIEQIFMVDATDVEMKINPFMNMRSGVLYVGDEPSTINNTWLKKHHKNPVFNPMYYTYSQRQLFNAGVVGGFRADVMHFLKLMIDFYAETKGIEQMTDMSALNYLVYFKIGAGKIISGRKVNTVFKAFDAENKSNSWFSHK
jgi:glycosyltransferase involved in cell wall biosynthesis